jgi:hypothetical protein
MQYIAYAAKCLNDHSQERTFWFVFGNRTMQHVFAYLQREYMRG